MEDKLRLHGKCRVSIEAAPLGRPDNRGVSRPVLGNLKPQELVDSPQCLRVGGSNHDLSARVGPCVIVVNFSM